jgi:hypothetical protein
MVRAGLKERERVSNAITRDRYAARFKGMGRREYARRIR